MVLHRAIVGTTVTTAACVASSLLTAGLAGCGATCASGNLAARAALVAGTGIRTRGGCGTIG